jgi:hypothetical protein
MLMINDDVYGDSIDIVIAEKIYNCNFVELHQNFGSNYYTIQEDNSTSETKKYLLFKSNTYHPIEIKESIGGKRNRTNKTRKNKRKNHLFLKNR